MANLYINPAGQPVRRHSFSSGELFEECPRRYELYKIRGYKRKDKSAALVFGRALESGLQFYHDNKLTPDSGVDEFKRLFLKAKDNTELRYTAAEKDWANLYTVGSEMLKLYEVVLPTLPIVNPVWQASVAKEVFPDTTLSGIEDCGYLDIISRPPWGHPLLPKVQAPGDSPYRPLIVDVKTSGKPLDVEPRFMALDPQLAHYAWLSGIRDIGFLWFTKSVADAFQKGTEITLLESSGKWTAGTELAVFRCEDDGAVLAGTADDLTEIRTLQEAFKGKGSTEAKENVVQNFLIAGRLLILPAGSFTKQRLQFMATRISEEDIVEAGNRTARQIVDIVDCSAKGVFPKKPGIRFPSRKCPMCSHRGICLDDPKLTEDLLVQITPAKPEEDWLAELDADE